jgi:hypothetical protein
MNIQQVVNRGKRKQREGKGKLGNSTLHHCIARVAVDGHPSYGADTQIERNEI